MPGLERPDEGTIYIDGRDVTRDPPGTRDIAFVFQQYSLYPHLTVLRQSGLSAALAGPPHPRTGDPQTRRADGASCCTSTDKLANRATKLSGGEMQRVAIGRALVRRPAIYLMDEPLSSLDAKLRAELRLELKRIQRELGATILYVTHDQIEAMTMAIADRRDRGRRADPARHAARDLREAEQRLCREPARHAVDQSPSAPALPDAAMPPGADTIGVRTEHLQIAKANGGAIVGRVAASNISATRITFTSSSRPRCW